MDFRSLIALANAGSTPAVEFKAKAEDWEDYPAEGMRATVIGGSLQADGVAKLHLDYRAFDAFNAALEQACYYDRNGSPTLTAREAGYYREVDSVYVMADDAVADYLTLLADERTQLLTEYGSLTAPRPSYAAWLEQQLLEARAALASKNG